MCSFLVQIIYGVCAVITLILTIVAMAVNAWTTVGEKATGLFPCPDVLKTTSATDLTKLTCDPTTFDLSKFGAMSGGDKAILACLILAVIMEVVCIAYNLFTAFACCCKAILLYVLLAFTLFVVLMLGVVVGVSASRNPAGFEGAMNQIKADGEAAAGAGSMKDVATGSVGKSFFMVVVAFVAAIIDTVVCGVAIFCAKKAV